MSEFDRNCALRNSRFGSWWHVCFKNFINANSQKKNLNPSLQASVVENSSQQNFSVKVVFLVGRVQNNETQLRINEESEFNNDLIQESFLDTYNNLTLKTVMMLKWVNNNCIDKGERKLRWYSYICRFHTIYWFQFQLNF